MSNRTGRRLGRHRRQFDRFAKAVRDHCGRGDEVLECELDECRGLADELDGLESDPEHSAHTYSVLVRTYHDLRQSPASRIPTAVMLDPIAELDDPLAAALRYTETV